MAQPNRRHSHPWIRDIQVACSTSTRLDSHDIGPSDSGVFRFQDGQEQGGKREEITPFGSIASRRAETIIPFGSIASRRSTARKDRQKDNPLDAAG